MKRIVLAVLIVFFSAGLFAGPDIRERFLDSTNLWVKDDLKGFLEAVPRDVRVNHASISDEVIVDWYVNFLFLENPTNSAGIAEWHHQVPECDWMSIRTGIIEDIYCNAMATNENYLCAVARAYKQAKRDRPQSPENPYPPTRVLDNGVTVTEVPSLDDPRYVAFCKAALFARDAQRQWDQYIQALERRSFIAVRRSDVFTADQKERLLDRMAREAGLSDEERQVLGCPPAK